METKELEKELNYSFSCKELLLTALTHSSATAFLREASNQRLEFLGDAVLQLIISTYLYEYFEHEDEGLLSKCRALIVCADSLEVIAKDIHLSKYLIVGKCEELDGGRKKKNIVADALESIIAAIYLDGGYDRAKEFVMTKFKHIIDLAVSGKLTYDYKTLLQEYAGHNGLGEIHYRLMNITGPKHAQTFYSCAVVNGKEYSVATGTSRKHAEQHAAELAYKTIRD